MRDVIQNSLCETAEGSRLNSTFPGSVSFQACNWNSKGVGDGRASLLGVWYEIVGTGNLIEISVCDSK